MDAVGRILKELQEIEWQGIHSTDQEYHWLYVFDDGVSRDTFWYQDHPRRQGEPDYRQGLPWLPAGDNLLYLFDQQEFRQEIEKLTAGEVLVGRVYFTGCRHTGGNELRAVQDEGLAIDRTDNGEIELGWMIGGEIVEWYRKMTEI